MGMLCLQLPFTEAGQSPVDMERVDLFSYPTVAHVPWRWSTLWPGDCMFVPAGESGGACRQGGVSLGGGGGGEGGRACAAVGVSSGGLSSRVRVARGRVARGYVARGGGGGGGGGACR